MANDYCALADVTATQVESGLSSSTDYDALFTTLITRASRLIDKECKRKPGAFAVTSSDEETRYYTGSGCSQQWVDEMAAAPSSVGMSEGGGVQSSDYTAIGSTDYFLWPDNAAVDLEPYRRLDLDVLNGGYATWYAFRKGIKVTAAFGYSTTDNTPEIITQACIEQVVRWFKRGQQGYQDTGMIPELGQLKYTQALDPEIAEMLAHYKRMTV